MGQRWLALAFIALGQLMVALDATVVNIALPTAQAALRFSDADRQWVITAYTLAFGGLLLLGGRIADSARLGRKRALLIGLIGFAAASLLSGTAGNLAILAAARALQGAFAALLAPTALSLLAVMFTEPSERARAFGLYGGIAASGGAIGLLVGGLLTQFMDWRWCLFVNVPIALIAAIGASRVLTDARRPVEAGQREPFDLLGLLLGSGGLVALVTGCGQAASQGWTSGGVLALLLGSVVAFGVFVVREARSSAPLLPLHIVFERRRGAAYLSALLAIAGMFGAFLFLTYDLQVVLGLAPLQAGLAFLPMSASAFVVATAVAPRLVSRASPQALMLAGFGMAATGMAMLSRLGVDSGYALNILPAEVLLGLGTACVMVPAANMATSGVSPREAGIASATLNSAQQIGAAVGIAVLNTVAASATAAYAIASPSATRPETLVHGYAAAALLGTVLLLAGAAVAALLVPRASRDPLKGVWRWRPG